MTDKDRAGAELIIALGALGAIRRRIDDDYEGGVRDDDRDGAESRVIDAAYAWADASSSPLATRLVEPPLVNDLVARAEHWLASNPDQPYGTAEAETLLDVQHHNDAYDIIEELLKALPVGRLVDPSPLKESARSFNEDEAIKAAEHCSHCGGPYTFDVSIPSVRWNAVIRASGLTEYLCATCILREFARRGESFTAILAGDEFNLLPIEVIVNGQGAKDLEALNDENNRLRCRVRELEALSSAARVDPSPLEDFLRHVRGIDGSAPFDSWSSALLGTGISDKFQRSKSNASNIAGPAKHEELQTSSTREVLNVKETR